MFNKRGQIGETMTWVVATIIIIVILTLSVFIAGGSDRAKKVAGLDKTVKNIPGMDKSISKSLFSYLLTKKNQEIIFNQIKQSGDFNSLNGKLAVDIFQDFYKDDYQIAMWIDNKKNSYFSNIIASPKDLSFNKVKLSKTSELSLMSAKK